MFKLLFLIVLFSLFLFFGSTGISENSLLTIADHLSPPHNIFQKTLATRKVYVDISDTVPFTFFIAICG